MSDEAPAKADADVVDLAPKQARPAPAPPRPHANTNRDPLSTATMAELYASQGFVEKALRIYRELLSEEPANLTYTRRASELERAIAAAAEVERAAAPAAAARTASAPVAPAAAAPSEMSDAMNVDLGPEGETIALLDGWLDAIRRNRHAV